MSIAISISNSVKGSLIPGGGGTPFVNEYSLSFDGVSDYALGGSTFSTLNGATKMSLSCWVKPTLNSIDEVISCGYASGVLFQLRIYNTGVVRFQFNTTSFYTTTGAGAISANVWSHILICIDKTLGTSAERGRIFINGVENQSNNLNTVAMGTATTPLYIGVGYGITNPYEGLVDEVAIWSGTDLRSESSSIYNGGVPFDLATYSTVPDHYYRMGDGDTWKENLFLRSNDFTNAYWAKSNVTLTPNAIDSPIGTLTATKLVETAVSGIHLVQKGSTAVPLPITRNASIYLKAGERTQVYLDYNFGFGYKNTIVDLSSGSIVSSTFTNTPTLTDQGDGWYRFDYYETNTSTSVTPLRVFIYNGGISYLGDGTSGVYIAGAQWVDSTEVGNYVETTTSVLQNWTLSDNVGAYDLNSVSMPEEARLPISPNSYSQYSFVFDGIGDYIYAGTSSLGITGAISVSAWVKIPTTNTGGVSSPYIQVIACEDNTSGGQRNWNLYWRGTGYNYFAWIIHHTNLSISSVTSIGVVPNDGQWHHLLGTFDGTTNVNGIKLYVDGVLNNQATALSTGVNSYATTEATIGATTGGGSWRLEGTIDEVAVWNTDQSSNISTIYGNGVPTDISSLSPLSHWRMGENATWDGANWTLTDQGSGGNDATSVSMPEEAKTGDQPYVI